MQQKDLNVTSSNLTQINNAVRKFKLMCLNDIKEFQGGQLSKFINPWKELTSDKNILNIVAGDYIQFTEKPPRRLFASNSLASEEYPMIRILISQMLKRGIIKPSCHEDIEFVSPIFTRIKGDGGIRIIFEI